MNLARYQQAGLNKSHQMGLDEGASSAGGTPDPGAPSLSGTLTFATISTAYDQTLTTTAGMAPLSYDISAGTLPAGLSINSSTGEITGTPTAYGDNSFTVRVTDALSRTATSAQSVTVYGPEMAGTVTDGGWTIGLNGGAAGTITQDGSGIHMAGANNLAFVSRAVTGAVDNATYEIVMGCSSITASGFKGFIYGATTVHAGATSTHNVAGGIGPFTERVTTSAAGSFANQVRIQCTGTSGTGNTYTINLFSCKRVG